jgi:hypothetical protein
MKLRNPNAAARFQNVTAQSKIINVGNNLGLSGLKNQQGTTVIKYDTLPLDGRTQYNFFQEANTRPFPFSNTGTDGGKLGVGESLTIQRLSFAIVTEVGVNKALEFEPLTKGDAGIIDGELTISVANSNICLRLPIAQFLPEFNKDAENAINTSYELDTLLIIPPQLDYTFSLRVSGLVQEGAYLRLTVEGVGSIFSPRTTL